MPTSPLPLPASPQAASLNVPQAFAEALRCHEQGRLPEAERLYEAILAVRADHFDALQMLAVVKHAKGQPAEALRLVSQAMTLRRPSPQILLNYGMILHALDRSDEAISSFDQALKQKSKFAEAHNNRGAVLSALGRQDEAIEALRKALTLKSDYADAHYNLGSALRALGRNEEALASFDRALALQPNFAKAHNNRGTALEALNRLSEALAAYGRALELNPEFGEACRNRGRVLLLLDRGDEAIENFTAALRLKPDDPETWYLRGRHLIDLGRTDEAAADLAQALALRPGHAGARIAACMAELAIVYADEAEVRRRRDAYERKLRGARRRRRGRPPQWRPHRRHRRAAAVLARLSGRQRPAAAGDLWRHGPRRRLAHIQAGAAAAAALARRADPRRHRQRSFSSAIRTGRSRSRAGSASSTAAASRSPAITSASRATARPMSPPRCATVSSTARSTSQGGATRSSPTRRTSLIYPGLLMDTHSLQLAAQRLAPVQMTSWGHPETSGLPTLDYFLSSDLMEAPDAQEHYTETLVRLPNLSIYYEPVNTPPEPVTREELGLRESATVFWSAQSLYKYLPQHDDIYARIAKDAGDCQIVFLRHHGGSVTDVVRARLTRAFAAHGLDADRYCAFLPRMTQGKFVAAAGLADIFLDSIGWSACNSALESLAHDLPIVTYAAPMMRGRHSTAILEVLGVPETIGRTPDEVVAIAVRLARNPGERREIVSRMAAEKHRLYFDRAPVAALQDFLERAVRG